MRRARIARSIVDRAGIALQQRLVGVGCAAASFALVIAAPSAPARAVRRRRRRARSTRQSPRSMPSITPRSFSVRSAARRSALPAFDRLSARQMRERSSAARLARASRTASRRSPCVQASCRLRIERRARSSRVGGASRQRRRRADRSRHRSPRRDAPKAHTHRHSACRDRPRARSLRQGEHQPG